MLLNRPDQFLPFLAEPVDPLRKTWNVITILFELSVWHIDDRLPGMRMQGNENGRRRNTSSPSISQQMYQTTGSACSRTEELSHDSDRTLGVTPPPFCGTLLG